MKFAWASLGGLVSAAIDDDAVLLSVNSVRESLGGESGLSAMIDFARESNPRKAKSLLQQFAKNTLVRGEEVDDVTKQKLKEIGAQLTNNTWMALEQSHRRDQDLLDKHWRAIQECGDKHIAHMAQDIDGFEVQQVRTHELDMVMCRGLPNHTNPDAVLLQTTATNTYPGERKNNGHKNTDQKGINYQELDNTLPDDYDTMDWLSDTPFAVYKQEDGSYQRFFKHISKMYTHEGSYHHTNSLLKIKDDLCDVCGELSSFLEDLQTNKPNCQPTLIRRKQDPQCTTEAESLIDTNLDQWFDNLVEYSESKLEKWQELKAGCDAKKKEYAEKDKHCDEEQLQYEQSFCAYRQGLHSTCAEYQGCHILTEEQYRALISDVLYAADSRKIDWKAIHKIACYIKVLISDGTNQERTWALENCESGNLNTLATILTGINETNYLSIIIPEISGNVSCWDMEVPPLIDFKECDMSSVHQYPCTENWMNRYNGFESPGDCSACNALPEHMQYSDKNFQETDHVTSDEYGGGWIFVNELGRSAQDLDDLAEIQPDGYFLPEYNMKGLRYNEVLVQRMSANWCDSWGRQSSKWVENDGASMCVQADNDHVYCMSNHDDDPTDDIPAKHSWRQQPTSHFAALCNKPGMPKCDCWPFEEGLDHVCFAYGKDAKGPAAKNLPAPRHVTVHSLEEDGSVVKVSFRGEEKAGVLRVGPYGSFLDGVGCGAVTPVKYRVFVRCLGCVTERSDFHTKDGAQFNGVMHMGHFSKADNQEHDEYTYEAWFRSPLKGKFRREIFGGANSGFTLVNENHGGECAEGTSYRVHVGNSNVYSKVCFEPNLMYHVAVTKSHKHGVHVYVNGQDSTFRDEHGVVGASKLFNSFGGGFTDGGQLFNVRIWKIERSAEELRTNAAITAEEHLSGGKAVEAGLKHWWPLTDSIQDIVTGSLLTGEEDVRYAQIWCSDLEATGMRVC
jgi:hypothetical protein